MRKQAYAVVLIFWMTQVVAADECKRNLSFNAADNSAAIAYSGCSDMPASIAPSDQPVTITIGSSRMSATVTRFIPATFGGVGPSIIVLTPLTQPGSRNVQPGDAPEYSASTATVELAALSGDNTAKTYKFAAIIATPASHHEHKGTIGPANGDQSSSASGTSTGGGDSTGSNSTTSAMRFQYTGAYVVFPTPSSAKEPYWKRGLQEEFTVSADTTNQKNSSFIDDNRASAAVYLPRATFGSLLNRARVGIQGQFSRAFHSTAHDFDTTLVAEGWLPLFQSVTLFSRSSYLSPPVNFSLSWGHRDQNVGGAASHGTLFTVLVGYHLYLLDHYRVDLQEQTTVNNAAAAASSTAPKTQHGFKASILYSSSATSKFAAVASFDSGHSGPVFTKLRQYFVGIGLQHLFDKPATQ